MHILTTKERQELKKVFLAISVNENKYWKFKKNLSVFSKKVAKKVVKKSKFLLKFR